MKVLSFNPNPEKGYTELIVEKDEKSAETIVYELPDSMLIQMSTIIPILSEKQKIQELLDLAYSIEKEQLLTIEGISKKIDELEEEHRDVREELKEPHDKDEINALCARSKDLMAVKGLYTDKRHTIKLLQMKVADYRARIAKMQAGFEQ